MSKNLGKILLALFFIPILLYGCAPAPLKDVVWPQDPQETPRIKYIKSYYGANAFKEANLAVELLIGGEGGFLMKKPMGVYVDNGGTIYVADTAVQDIFVFNQSQKTTSSLRQMKVNDINKPIAITSDEKTGRIFFTDSFANWVSVVNKDGTVVTLDAPEHFKQPSGIALDPDKRRLYVSDTQHHDIKVFDLDTLKYITTIGSRGKNEGQFNFPSHITVDKNGKLYVADTMNGRVQVFNNEGKFILTFGQFGDAPGMFARPKGVGVDSEGHIYVVDAAFNNVQIFNEEGRILLFFGGFGDGRGEMVLPAGLAIDKDDYIYVVDSWNRRINIYEYLGEKHNEREAKLNAPKGSEKTEPKPKAEPTTQPPAQPATPPTAQPTAQPAAQPATQSTTKPVTQPATQPAAQPTTQPTTKPASQPPAQPATQPAVTK